MNVLTVPKHISKISLWPLFLIYDAETGFFAIAVSLNKSFVYLF